MTEFLFARLNEAGVIAPAEGGTGTSTVFTAGSVVFAGPSGIYAQDNANLFWDNTANSLGLGTSTLQADARLTIAGNVHVTGSNPMFAIPYYTFDISAPTGHASFAIDSITVAPDGNALLVQSVNSGAGISSGGAGFFGVVNNSTGGGWDGYALFTSLNTPNTQATPGGSSLWGTLRGERAQGGTALDAVRATNEMSYDAVVTFDTATDAVLWTAHGLIANDPVAFTTTGVLPTGITADTKVFVKTVLSANSFTLSATAGGALIDLTGVPTPTTTAHVYQNPARGLIVFNSTKYNAFNWGLQVPSAVQYGVQVGDPVFATSHIIPAHPFSFFNGDATPKELFFVNNDGTVNLKTASNVNTRFLTMKGSSDADTAIMAIAMQNASGADRMLQWTDVTTATYRFKSAGTISLHTNNVAISAAGQALTLSTSQGVQFNAYGTGTIVSDVSGNLTSNTETGTGSSVRATSPTLVTPALGTPSALVLTNATGLPVGSITGLGTGVATFLATPSSANLATAVTGETGTAGGVVFSVAPTITTLSAASAAAGNSTPLTMVAGGNLATDVPQFRITSLAGTVVFNQFGDALNGHFRIKALGNVSFHAGNVGISATNEFLKINTTGQTDLLPAVAVVSGGDTGMALRLSSSLIGVYAGTDAPTIPAAKGSLYLRSNGSATNNRAYINTDGGTTWTAITTVA